MASKLKEWMCPLFSGPITEAAAKQLNRKCPNCGRKLVSFAEKPDKNPLNKKGK